MDQSLDSQHDNLNCTGVERIFSEKVGGVSQDKPELKRLLDHLRPDDVVVVTKLDRLSRSLRDLLTIVDQIGDKGAHFHSLSENINTQDAAGRLMFHVFGVLAQFETDRIRERTIEGLNAARARGRKGGRPRALTSEQIQVVRRMHSQGRGISELSRLFQVTRQTIRRAIERPKSTPHDQT